eukprot:891664-Pyramimonas_sp.AAC.1
MTKYSGQTGIRSVVEEGRPKIVRAGPNDTQKTPTRDQAGFQVQEERVVRDDVQRAAQRTALKHPRVHVVE